MMDIGDYAAASEPVKRVLGMLQQAFGAVFRPMLARSNAKAKAFEIEVLAQARAAEKKLMAEATAHEIKTVASAIADTQSLLVDAEVSGETVVVKSASEQWKEISARAEAREKYQSAQRQANVEAAVFEALYALRDETKVSGDEPSAEWSARFFRIVEDISNEDLLKMWGQILAGEVRKSGSISLRTLEVLRNLSQREAQAFARAAKFAVHVGDKSIVPRAAEIGPDDLAALREAGIVVADALSSMVLRWPEHKNTDQESMIFQTGTGKALVIIRAKGAPEVELPIWPLTTAGRELLPLVGVAQFDRDFCVAVAKAFEKPETIVMIGNAEKVNADGLFKISGTETLWPVSVK